MEKINILGSEYTIKEQQLGDTADGYCDWSINQIVIDKFSPSSDSLADLERYKNSVLRHEIIHAFLFESGLAQNSDWALNEEMVDYFARQFPKMLEVFKKVGCI